MKVSFVNKLTNDYDVYVFLVKEGKTELNKLEKELDIKFNEKLRKDFEGKDNQTANLYIQNKKNLYHVVLGGLGKEKKGDELCELLRRKTGKCIKSIRNSKASRILFSLYNLDENNVRAQVEGALLATYKNIKYKTKKNTDKTLSEEKDTIDSKTKINEIVFYHSNSTKSSKVNKIIDETTKICDVIHYIRDIINQPANDLNPKTYVDGVKSYIKTQKLPISTQVLEEDKLNKLGMNLMVSVGKGSDENGRSRLVILRYNNSKGIPIKEKDNLDAEEENNENNENNKNKSKEKKSKKKSKKKYNKKGGAKKSKKPSPKTSKTSKSSKSSSNQPIVLIGKGITFDSGGISIKPSKHMYEMKADMIGSAVVLGVILSLAKIKARCNVIAMLALSENMPGTGATRPGDIYKSLSGKTVEITNTDAEGRLVLADSLTYAEKNLNPKCVIDFATLTGSQELISCGHFSSIMSHHPQLVKDLIDSGNITGERLVEIPLYPEFEEYIKSETADIQNIAKGCRYGTVIGGIFLSNFITKKTPWAHIDIASTSWNNKAKEYNEKEGTDVGIRMLIDFIRK